MSPLHSCAAGCCKNKPASDSLLPMTFSSPLIPYIAILTGQHLRDLSSCLLASGPDPCSGGNRHAENRTLKPSRRQQRAGEFKIPAYLPESWKVNLSVWPYADALIGVAWSPENEEIEVALIFLMLMIDNEGQPCNHDLRLQGIRRIHIQLRYSRLDEG